MKICFIAGADSIHSIKWIRYFADKGHDVHWISFTPPNETDLQKMEFHYIKTIVKKFQPINLLSNIIQVKTLITKIKPDILHAHYAGVNGFVAASTGFHPFILTAWGSDILFSAKSIIKGPFIKFALQKADLITCDADHMVDAIIKLGVDNKKITILYFGIDVDKFKPNMADEQLKSKLLLGHQPSIISLRSLETLYDIGTLIRAMPNVLAEFPEAKFLIAGKGTEENSLKKLVGLLEVSNNVLFIGFIPNDQLPRYLSLADVYISTSLSDAGIAASTAEAMACGLPVIITDSGENSKWVIDGENGYIVRTKDHDAIAKNIIKLLKNTDLRSRLGNAARANIVKNNNYQVEMAKMETIYKSMIRNNE